MSEAAKHCLKRWMKPRKLRETERKPGGTIAYHGHTAKWNELEQPQKNVAQKTGLIDDRGKIVKR